MSQKKIILISISAIVLCILGVVVYVSFASEDNTYFPRKPIGEFVMQPIIEENNGEKMVRWIIPEKCKANEYEVQQVTHVNADSIDLLSGGSATCTEAQSGFECTTVLSAESYNKNEQWKAQVHHYKCSSNPNDVSSQYVSSVVQFEY